GRPGGVEVMVPEARAALAQKPRTHGEHEHPDGNVDEEDPRPAQGARQGAAEEDTGRTAAPGGGAPDPEGEVALPPLGEGRRQRREGGGSEQCGTEPLKGAEGDQRPLRPGEPVE